MKKKGLFNRVLPTTNAPSDTTPSQRPVYQELFPQLSIINDNLDKIQELTGLSKEEMPTFRYNNEYIENLEQHIPEFLEKHYDQTGELLLKKSDLDCLREEILEKVEDDLVSFYTKILNRLFVNNESTENKAHGVIVDAWPHPQRLYD